MGAAIDRLAQEQDAFIIETNPIASTARAQALEALGRWGYLAVQAVQFPLAGEFPRAVEAQKTDYIGHFDKPVLPGVYAAWRRLERALQSPLAWTSRS